MNLYQISTDLQEILSHLEENELTPEIESGLIVKQEELQNKAIDYGYAIKNLEAEAEVIDIEIKRLTQLKKARTNTADRLKETIKSAMVVFGIDSVKTPTISLTLRNYPSVQVDETILEERFINEKITRSPDKTKIKKAIEAGEHVTGASLEFNPSLLIK